MQSLRRPAGRLCRLLLLGLAVAWPLSAQQSAQRVVRQLKFQGNRRIDATTLAASISTTNSGWFATLKLLSWIGLGQKRYFNETDFQRDVLRLEVLYKRSGYPDAVIDTIVRRTPQDIYLTFKIAEGEPVRVTRLTVAGLDAVPAETRAAALVDLPLVVGNPFNRFVLQTTIDTVAGRLRDRGYPAAEIFREFTSDATRRTAEVTLNVVTGLRSHVGTVRVEGSTRVDSSLARKLVVTRTGRLYSAQEVLESQRSLYQSDLYAIASVGIDSARYDPASDAVPLLIRVSDAKARRVRAGLGYGTNDCFRASTGITERDFLGGGRIFDLSARVSKIGVGNPFDFGLDQNICRATRSDSVGSAKFNYNVTASVRRPAFLAPRNTIAGSVFSERRSEYRVYLREEVGASVSLTRESARRRNPLSLTYLLSYGRTTATPASFCASFSACTPALIELQQERRRLGLLTAAASFPHANSPIDPTRGYIAILEAAISSRVLLSSSEQEFSRLLGNIAWYRTLSREVVLSWRVRGGIVFARNFQAASDAGGSNVSFVPLEQRFYGGGANDVRGFQQNELGPVVYVVPKSALDSAGTPAQLTNNQVRVAPTGGNTIVVGNVELRFPSPVFRSRMRLALFLDAGSVWDRSDSASRKLIRFTPGAGVRFATPLGPARFDVAYNPYARQAGPLYQTDSTGALVPVPGQTAFVPPQGRRFTIHISVGQAF